MIGLMGELVLGNTLLSLGLAGVAWIVHHHGRHPALAHLLWVLVLVKLISPPLFVLSLPLVQLAAAPVAGQPLLAAPAIPAEAVDAPAAWVGRHGAALLLLAWLIGSATVLAVSLVRIRRFGRLLQVTAAPPPPGLPALATSVGRELGLRTVPAIQLTSAHISPMTWWRRGRVTVVLPATLLPRLDGDELRWVLAHELAHVKRRDHLVRWVEWAACVAFWWNPVVWCARRYLRLDEEDACDALVLQRVVGTPRAYAGTLLNVVEILARPAGSVPAMATGIDAARSLEHRLASIVAARPRSAVPGPVMVGVSALATAVMVVGFGSPDGGAGSTTATAPPGATDSAMPGPLPAGFADHERERRASVSARLPVGMTVAATTYLGTADRDSFAGSEADEIIRGRGGADVLSGGPGRDTIAGGDGADRIHGGAGRDTLLGGPGRDILDGGAGRDRIEAGRGDDVIRAWSDGTPDQVDCGAGVDRAVIDRSDTTRRCETVIVREPS